MPRDVAEPLFHRLLESFPPRRAYGPPAFAQEPMPAPVAHFLSHWLRHRLRHEATRLELPRSDWFDYEHDAVQQARRALAGALIKHGHFPAAIWEASLREAVHQVIAYLVRPASTLAAFIFQNESRAVPAEVMAWRLGYFEPYSYIREGIQPYLDERQGRDVERDPVAEQFRTIDRQETQAYTPDAWLNVLAPLFDLAGHAGEQRLPVPLLVAFFEDKGVDAIVRRLAAHQGSEALDEDELRRMLEAINKPAATPPPFLQAEPAQDGPVPRWKQFQQQPPAAASPPRPPARPRAPRVVPRTPDEVPTPPAAQDAQPRWKQFRPESEPEAAPAPLEPPASPEPPSDLAALEHAVLGQEAASNRDLFITTLFAHSTDAYERVLRQLHTTPSWTEASKIIADAVFRTFQVNIYSDPAILFTDAVEAGYLKRKT